MYVADILLAGGVAVVCGLDRTAVCQFMLSRPIVAAPLTGYLLGDPSLGLKIGAILELLWLGRLPVGASIPPDDTQVAIGATTLAVTMGESIAPESAMFFVLCTMVAMPLGKVGQLFDRLARYRNETLDRKVSNAIVCGETEKIERFHLVGLLNFAAASLVTYSIIVLVGALILKLIGPLLTAPIHQDLPWLQVLFPLVGVSVILSTMNVRRAMTLFGASFTSAFLMLWLL